MTKDWNFGPILGPQNWASDAHILYISESTSNEHLKQDSHESWGKILHKITWISTHLEAQNEPKISASGAYHLRAYKSSSSELINQVSSKSSGNFSRK